jgi:predicted Zn-dependent peptidase
MYKIREYANGLKLIYKKMEGVSSASLGLWVNTGSRNETVRNNGVSHFLEHLLFKGSKRYTNDEIKETIEGRGGVLNAFTSEENTCYYAKFLGRDLKKVAAVLSDMVLYPTLKVEDIDKERTVIIEEIKMYKDMPVFQAAEIFDELMWPGHALGRNIAGNAEIISKIPREQIASYHGAWYQPVSIVVSAAGDLHEGVLEDFAVKTFGRVASSRERSIDVYKDAVGEPQVKIVSKDIEQTHFNLGFPALSRAHKDRFILAVLNVILGGNMSSRLFNEVREKKGLAYDIASHAKRLKDCGVFFVHAGVDHRNLAQAAEVIIRELRRVKTELVPAPELKRAKEYLIAQSKMALDDTMEHMLWMGDSLMNMGMVQTREEVAAAIARVIAQDIRRVAGTIIDWQRVRVAAVGPKIGEQAVQIRGMLSKD